MEDISRLVRLAVLGECRHAGRIGLHARHDSPQRSGQRLADLEAILGEPDSRLHKCGPGLGAESVVSQGKSGNRARHSHRQVAIVVEISGVLTSLVEKHLRVSRQRCLLPEVQRYRLTIREADDHETAAADVPCGGVGHCESEPGGNGRVDGVAPGAQDPAADLAGQSVGGHHHAVFRP